METTLGSSLPFTAELAANLPPPTLAHLNRYLDELEMRRGAAARRTEAARASKAAADEARRRALLEAVAQVAAGLHHLDARDRTSVVALQLANPRLLGRFELDCAPDERTVRKALRALGLIPPAQKRS